jgi:tagatose 1,6-diphosphate aldolase
MQSLSRTSDEFEAVSQVPLMAKDRFVGDVEGYDGGRLDGDTGAPIWSAEEARAWVARMDELAPVPWVLLSAGVGPRTFEAGLRLALGAGASGFLAGRAVWLDALTGWPDRDAVTAALRAGSGPYLRAIGVLAEAGVPWFEHRRFGGAPRLADAGPGWARAYAEDPG